MHALFAVLSSFNLSLSFASVFVPLSLRHPVTLSFTFTSVSVPLSLGHPVTLSLTLGPWQTLCIHLHLLFFSLAATWRLSFGRRISVGQATELHSDALHCCRGCDAGNCTQLGPIATFAPRAGQAIRWHGGTDKQIKIHATELALSSTSMQLMRRPRQYLEKTSWLLSKQIRV